jgi:hypothetical protein
MANKLSGGGITSNKLVRESVRGGSPNLTAYSPRGVSQLGVSQGSTLSKTGAFTTQNSALPLSDGQRRDFVPMGNQLATNVGAGGPGAGRTTYRAGSQSATPSVQMRQGGKDILSEFGREPTDPGPLVDRRS